MNRRYIALLTALTIVPLSSAKRLPPPNVKPVLSGSVEYSAHGDGTHAWVAATDVVTRKELWRAKVFRIHTHWWKGEEDNQWGFTFPNWNWNQTLCSSKTNEKDATPST